MGGGHLAQFTSSRFSVPCSAIVCVQGIAEWAPSEAQKLEAGFFDCKAAVFNLMSFHMASQRSGKFQSSFAPGTSKCVQLLGSGHEAWPDVETFIVQNQLNERAADALRHQAGTRVCFCRMRHGRLIVCGEGGLVRSRMWPHISIQGEVDPEIQMQAGVTLMQVTYSKGVSPLD